MGSAGSEILEVVGQLHEGVVDDDAWQSGLDATCAMIESPILLIASIDRGEVHSLLGHGLPRDFVEQLRRTFGTATDNPWVEAASTGPLRRVMTIDQIGSRPVLESSKIWKEYYGPFGIGDTAGAILERQPGSADAVKFLRRSDQPRFRTAELKAYAALIPHLARAWRVKRAITEWQTLAESLTFILDRLQRAVVVAGADGEVRFANRAADRLLSRGNAIDATRGRLRAARGHYSGALESLIVRAARTSVGDEAVAVDALSIRSIDDDAPLAVVAEPLAPAHGERLGHGSAPAAVLFIGDSEASTRPSVEHLAAVYGLTQAEARLTAQVVDGRNLTEAADVLGISPNTAKYHLKAVYDKVGVSRQAQLVRRVLADVGGLAEPDKLRPS